MKVERQQVGTVEVLAPLGPLVDDDAQEFCGILRTCISGPSSRVVVSMHEVPYMDSVALEGLLDASEELADRAMVLKLVNTTSTCREILDLTDLTGKFRFFHNVNDAVKSFL